MTCLQSDAPEGHPTIFFTSLPLSRTLKHCCWLSMCSLEGVNLTSPYSHAWSNHHHHHHHNKNIAQDSGWWTYHNILLKAIMVKQHTNSLDILWHSQKGTSYKLSTNVQHKHFLKINIYSYTTKPLRKLVHLAGTKVAKGMELIRWDKLWPCAAHTCVEQPL